MAKIESFNSIHYSPDAIDEVAKVLCPPYDIIDAKEQEELYQRHPYNYIRLILGKDFAGDAEVENKYKRASGYIEEWLRRSILIQEAQPGIYFYEQVFTLEGKRKTRLGFMALMRLDEEGQNKTIYPHEHTHQAPKEDRFKLMKCVEANLSPIFTIFSDPEKFTHGIFEKKVKPALKPLFDVTDWMGIEHRLWSVNEKALTEEIKEFMKDKDIFIADGHHRYEVAKWFRDYKRQNSQAAFKDSYNYIMTFFTPLEDEGLCVLPTHRLIKNVHFNPESLSSCFLIKEMESKEALVKEMEEKKDEVGVFGLYQNNKFYLLKISEKRECNRFIQEGPKEYKNLDVVILHKVIFDNFLKIQLSQIQYEVNLDTAVASVDQKVHDCLFILNPTKIEQIKSIALGGEVMPQKSTYFYPKLMSGFLIHKF
jgi:uncharacterized protein (DUF1015 family)